MKKYVLLLIGLAFLLPPSVMAEDFLEAPVVPGGKVLLKTDSRLELSVPKGHSEVLEYYKDALKSFKDIRVREWKNETYIEDDGKLPWHSITISKGGTGETKVIIVKDNWTWILGTLVLRFVGVFIVLLLLFVAMGISGSIISKSVARAEAKKAAG
ncbi:MAG: hypothetical protein JRI80_15595 [Deltaproteobacteria bacterium]|nr:hypothetical protein [Deltaproteobacteria bacterium]